MACCELAWVCAYSGDSPQAAPFFKCNVHCDSIYITVPFILLLFACHCHFDPTHAMRGTLCLYEDDPAGRYDGKYDPLLLSTRFGLRLAVWLTNKNSTPEQVTSSRIPCAIVENVRS